MDTCVRHSGFEEAIDNLKSSDSMQWREFDEVRSRIDNIMTRLNFILGGIIVSIIMLLINVLFKIV